MPIQFHCPQCDHLLQTPDGSEGKKARCPSCSHIVEVPHTPAPPLGTGGGFPAGGEPGEPHRDAVRDESPWPSAPEPLDPGAYGRRYPDQEFNPFASPKASTSPEYSGEFGQGRTGPPWERDGASVQSFIETVKQVVTNPTELFRQMRRDGGLGSPLGFSLIAGCIGGFFAVIFQFAINGSLIAIQGGGGRGGFGPIELLLIAIMMLIFYPLGIMIGNLLSSAIFHVCLMLVGGARFNFETTFRAFCYSCGTLQLANIIPCVGGWIAGIGGLVYFIIALVHTHEISGAKATLAVVVPAILCFCAVILLTALTVALPMQN